MKSNTSFICIVTGITGAFILGGTTAFLVIRHCLTRKRQCVSPDCENNDNADSKKCITGREPYEYGGNNNEH